MAAKQEEPVMAVRVRSEPSWVGAQLVVRAYALVVPHQTRRVTRAVDGRETPHEERRAGGIR